MDGTNRRTFLKTTGAAATVSLAGCAGLGGGGDEMTIVAGTAPGFPPFEMKEGGELVGFDVDLLEAVVAETDYTLETWSEFEFSSLIPALTSDKIDVIAAAMTINDERDQTIDFSNPYYSADQSVLVREGGDFSPSELSDLSGHKVGAQEGTTGADQVKKLIEDGTMEESNFNTYGSYVLAVEDLQNGNIDAVVLDKPVAETFAADRPVNVAFVVTTNENYGFGIRTDDDDLQQALNSGLSTVKENGTYEDLVNKWFGAQN